MQYTINNKNGDKLSRLGLGCMRFMRRGAGIDQPKAEEVIKAAYEKGVNFFDTAYIYPGSEKSLGAALKSLDIREKVFISTKLPLFMCKKPEDFDKYFNRQLENLQTTYIDYYFMHMLPDIATWQRLCGLGIKDWLADKKAGGQIHNVGFSFHGGTDTYCKLVDIYDWDFTMIQYNYLDEFRQAGKAGLKYASDKGLAVFAMEPLRGGKLANGLSDKAKALFREAVPGRSPADWALRWVWDQPEVTLLLSGMNTTAQMNENTELVDIAVPGHLTERERNVYAVVRAEMDKKTAVPCTGCGYCMPCPKGIDIPSCFESYNKSFIEGKATALRDYFQFSGPLSPEHKGASLCIKCHKCEKHCPQNIPISYEMEKVSKRLESFWYIPVMNVIRRIMR